MKVTFYGAAQNVTGSKHLITTKDFTILLDCGLYQGRRSITKELNENFPFDAKRVDAVVLSHGHADHCGLLPILVKQGFKGSIYCTKATAEVAKYILEDSAKIQEHDTAYLNDHMGPGEDPVYPLYTMQDAELVLPHFSPQLYFRQSNEWIDLAPHVRLKFLDAGHILGSAITVLEITEDGKKKNLAFTGDLGPQHVPILHAPEYITEPLDALLMECTYGGRNHRPLDLAASELQKVILEAVHRKSKIIVPAFALGRTQELIYTLHKLTDSGKIPRIPIYIDSPLAVNLTEVFTRHGEDFNESAWDDFSRVHEWPLTFRNLQYIHSMEDSKKINTLHGPFIVIASSGMCEGGRILFHLKNNINDPNNFVLLTGYQAEHTLGRKLQEGFRRVKILGYDREVKAQVITLNEFSAHADQQGLLSYMDHLKPFKKLFLVHTELPEAEIFKQKVLEQYPPMDVAIPKLDQSFQI